jgi:hypothetical protein
MVRNSVMGLVVATSTLAVLAASAWAEPAGDKAAADATLAELGAPSASASAGLSLRPVGEAKRALERAVGARQAGEVARADLLEGLAREWAETAKDIVRAARAETDASTVEEKTAQATVRAERARTLLEESIALRGEKMARLEQMHAASAEPARPPAPAKKTAKDKAKAKAKDAAPKNVLPKDEPVKEAP